LQHGANVNERDADGRSCLHIAAHVGNIDVVRMLMKYKANTAITDNGGRTPLLIASWNDKVDVVKELLNNANTDPNHVDCQGATALSIASQKGNYDILSELLVHGAMINRSSRNPIKLALRGAFNNCVELLKNNLVLQQAAVAPTPPRNSRSYDSFRFVANNERKILSTLHEANNRMHQHVHAGGGLHSSLSMSNHFKMMPHVDNTVDDTLKSLFYIEPSYRMLKNNNKKPNPSISDDQDSMRIDASSTDHLPKAKTSTNNKILQILRKKFRIFRPTSKKQMTRSSTDATLTPTRNVNLQGLHDANDTAHIFKRTSLNGYFIKNNSIKQYQMEEEEDQVQDNEQAKKFPIPNGFKKETSI
jgi:ankyrin repeat protein